MSPKDPQGKKKSQILYSLSSLTVLTDIDYENTKKKNENKLQLG